MSFLKTLWRFWCCFWISVGPLGGLGIGVIGGNVIEAWMHDVSLYDATFVESWKTVEAD